MRARHNNLQQAWTLLPPNGVYVHVYVCTSRVFTATVSIRPFVSHTPVGQQALGMCSALSTGSEWPQEVITQESITQL